MYCTISRMLYSFHGIANDLVQYVQSSMSILEHGLSLSKFVDVKRKFLSRKVIIISVLQAFEASPHRYSQWALTRRSPLQLR